MEAVIYSNGNQECERAKIMKHLTYRFVYKLNHHFTHKGFIAEYGNEAEYPQVNVGFKHVGGLKETLNFMKDQGMFK